MSDQPLPRNLVTARLMTREYVRALVRHRDREFLIAHLWQVSGFRQQAIVGQETVAVAVNLFVPATA